MQQAEMVVGSEYAVEFPGGEAQSGSRYTGGGPVVRATLVEKGVVFTGTYGGQKKGVKVRLEAPFRTLSSRHEGFTIREPGYVFTVEARRVLRCWGAFDGQQRDDDAMQAAREARYAEQDELRAIFERLGAPETVLNDESVKFDRSELLRWLKRIDPRSVAVDAIDGFVEALDRNSEGDWITNRRALDVAKSQSLAEIDAGLAVTDEEIGLKDGYKVAGALSRQGDDF